MYFMCKLSIDIYLNLFLTLPYRWRLVTHCGIDGYSRLVVFLKCSNNNRATTVLGQFENAVGMYGIPSEMNITGRLPEAGNLKLIITRLLPGKTCAVI